MEIYRLLKEGYKLKEIYPQGDGYFFIFKKKGWTDCILWLDEHITKQSKLKKCGKNRGKNCA